jgi:EmrB/QacA subfamily drug resistance transporter
MNKLTEGRSLMENTRGFIRITVAIAAITSFVSTFTANAVTLGVSQISMEFMADQSLLNWVVTSNLLATAVLLLPFGRFADVVGRKKIFLFGAALFALSSLGCAVAFSFPMLIVFRALQGAAGAMLFSTNMAILTSVVPANERGKAIGLYTAVTYIGLASGPVLGGFICDMLSWRGLFYFALIIILAVFAMTLLKLKGEWRGEDGRFDIIGCILWISGLLLLLYGLSDIMGGSLYVLCFAAGLIVLAVFIAAEKKSGSPLLPLGVFRNKVFSFSCLAALISYTSTFGLTYLISLYLQTVLTLGISISGMILLANPVVVTVFSPIAGRLSDRMNPRHLAAIGMGITTAGIFLLIFLGRGTNFIFVVLILALIGLGFSLFSSPNANSIMGSAGRAYYGLASSALGTTRLLGQTMSMTIISLITSLGMKGLTLDSPLYADGLLKSTRIIYIVFTVLCVLAIFTSLAKAKKPEASEPPETDMHHFM